MLSWGILAQAISLIITHRTDDPSKLPPVISVVAAAAACTGIVPRAVKAKNLDPARPKLRLGAAAARNRNSEGIGPTEPGIYFTILTDVEEKLPAEGPAAASKGGDTTTEAEIAAAAAAAAVADTPPGTAHADGAAAHTLLLTLNPFCAPLLRDTLASALEVVAGPRLCEWSTPVNGTIEADTPLP